MKTLRDEIEEILIGLKYDEEICDLPPNIIIGATSLDVQQALDKILSLIAERLPISTEASVDIPDDCHWVYWKAQEDFRNEVLALLGEGDKNGNA